MIMFKRYLTVFGSVALLSISGTTISQACNTDVTVQNTTSNEVKLVGAWTQKNGGKKWVKNIALLKFPISSLVLARWDDLKERANKKVDYERKFSSVTTLRKKSTQFKWKLKYKIKNSKGKWDKAKEAIGPSAKCSDGHSVTLTN